MTTALPSHFYSHIFLFSESTCIFPHPDTPSYPSARGRYYSLIVVLNQEPALFEQARKEVLPRIHTRIHLPIDNRLNLIP
jgi:hypothetical protein